MDNTTPASNAPAPIKIFDLNKLTLWTPSPVIPNRNAQLRWGIRDGNPRLTVFTGEPADPKSNNFPMTAAMDAVTFYMFTEMFREILRKGKPDSQKLLCKGRRYDNGQPTQDKILRSVLYFGIDDNGMAWISVRVEGKPEIVFKYGISTWHCFVHKDGTEMSESEASIRSAMASLTLAEKLFMPFIEEAVRNPVNYKERSAQWDSSKGNKQGSHYESKPAPKENKEESFDSLFEDIPL